MSLLLVQGFGSLSGVLLLVALAAPGQNPFTIIVRAAQEATALPEGRLAIYAILSVASLNYAEGLIDPALTRWLRWDMTPAIHALEQDFVGQFQAWSPRAALLPLALAYVPGYLAILIVPLVLWTSARDRPVAARYVVAFVLNYAVALPFFLLVPVREVGASSLTSARPLLDSVWPGITAELRLGSPLDNCFPSMHVSCAVTTLWYAHKNGPPALRGISWVLVPSIAVSTLVLGIHWLSDVIAGVIVGLACSWFADRAFTRRSAAVQA